MRQETQKIVEKIGETDQLFLAGKSPELALERADLRLQLVTLSTIRQEQLYFLQEAIVLLEQGRVEFEEMPTALYLELSLYLAKAYMMYFELTQEQRYALITQQVLKPLSKAENGNVLFFLAYASAAKQEPAMTRHWLNKYHQNAEFDLSLVKQHPIFNHYHEQLWFNQLIQDQ